MARKSRNRAEAKEGTEAAHETEGLEGRPSKTRRVIDPAYQIRPLDDALLRAFFSWCPDEIRPRATPTNSGLTICGRLRLEMHGPRRGLWDLVGKDGWLMIEAVFFGSEPSGQYMICTARTCNGQRPGQIVSPSHLWLLWQPAYNPSFYRTLPDALAMPDEMRVTLDSDLESHLAETSREWSDRVFAAQLADLASDLVSLNARIDELDNERRALRKSGRTGDSALAAVRQQLLEAEERLAPLSNALMTPPVSVVIRQRLCEVARSVR